MIREGFPEEVCVVAGYKADSRGFSAHLASSWDSLLSPAPGDLLPG